MHGLILETSIWLLAGSTRYLYRILSKYDKCFHPNERTVTPAYTSIACYKTHSQTWDAAMKILRTHVFALKRELPNLSSFRENHQHPHTNVRGCIYVVYSLVSPDSSPGHISWHFDKIQSTMKPFRRTESKLQIYNISIPDTETTNALSPRVTSYPYTVPQTASLLEFLWWDCVPPPHCTMLTNCDNVGSNSFMSSR